MPLGDRGSGCGDRRHCEDALYTQATCAGHGHWEAPPALTLTRFVETVCAGAVRPLRPTENVRMPSSRRWREQPAGVWTARRYAELEREQSAAAEREAADEERREHERLHAERIERLIARQEDLAEPTRRLVGRLTQTQGRIDWGARGPEWAMGLPVEAGAHGVAAVVCPVAGRIEGAVCRRLADVLLVVLDERERDRVAQAAMPGQRIEVIPVDVPPPAAFDGGAITTSQP